MGRQCGGEHSRAVKGLAPLVEMSCCEMARYDDLPPGLSTGADDRKVKLNLIAMILHWLTEASKKF